MHRTNLNLVKGNKQIAETKNQAAPNTKYENTYKMKPDHRFKISALQSVLRTIMEEKLSGIKYDVVKMRELSISLPTIIKEKVKSMNIKRYKIIAYMQIVQKTDQSVFMASRCLLDGDYDFQTSYTFESPTFAAVGFIYASYYE